MRTIKALRDDLKRLNAELVTLKEELATEKKRICTCGNGKSKKRTWAEFTRHFFGSRGDDGIDPQPSEDEASHWWSNVYRSVANCVVPFLDDVSTVFGVSLRLTIRMAWWFCLFVVANLLGLIWLKFRLLLRAGCTLLRWLWNMPVIYIGRRLLWWLMRALRKIQWEDEALAGDMKKDMAKLMRMMQELQRQGPKREESKVKVGTRPPGTPRPKRILGAEHQWGQ